MSEPIKHECGIAFIRLLKPLSFYKEKYGSSRYGLIKMNQLMQKLINRGQDGAGIATLKLDLPITNQSIDRIRSAKAKAIDDIFTQVNDFYHTAKIENPKKYDDIDWQKNNIPFMGEVLLGHLRYGTFGKNNVENCHPFKRDGVLNSCDLVLAGNFNLTNIAELTDFLKNEGCQYDDNGDTVTMMETIGYHLDIQCAQLREKYLKDDLTEEELTLKIRENLDLSSILKNSSKNWDGGYVMGGILSGGNAFVMRDPNGIRPAFVFKNDEIIVITSERPIIQTVFNAPIESIEELRPGHVAIIAKNGEFSLQEINSSENIKACSFERIYFSRGNDASIYNERCSLGKNLTLHVLKAINYNLKDTVFSYIPNTAETAFEGLIEGINEYFDAIKAAEIHNLSSEVSVERIKDIVSNRPRVKKVIIKDVKQRTFITDDSNRNEMVNQVYDVSYNTINPYKDTLVVLDDSIVRGTTLKKSILDILDRLNPKKIIIISSAPQIRYPDCYGVDMSVLNNFIAFEATIQIIKEKRMDSFILELHKEVLNEMEKPASEQKNILRKLYAQVNYNEVSKKITELVKPQNLNAELEIIFQTVEGLSASCPNSTGDWYFTGNYPTCGGNKVVNQSLINYFENNNNRPY